MASLRCNLMQSVLTLAVAVIGLLTASPANADVLRFDFLMDGDQEVPPVVTNGEGYGVLWLDDVTGEFYLHASYASLDGDVTGAHLHGPADVGQVGDIIVPLTTTGLIDGTLSASGTLSSGEIADIAAGLTYVNIHTTLHVDGEIRGQVEPITSLRRFGFGADGDQVVPQVPTSGIADGSIYVSIRTGHYVVAGNYTALETDATVAALHGPADLGDNGDVISTLAVSGGTDGELSGHGMLTGPQLAAMLDGRTYITVSTTNYPAGEIRGQNWNLRILPLDPGIAGKDNLIEVIDAGPYEILSFAYSQAIGATDVPGCFGVQVMLVQPKIFASATTDLNGHVSFFRTVPLNASGLTIHIQVLEAGTCAPSNLLTTVFP